MGHLIDFMFDSNVGFFFGGGGSVPEHSAEFTLIPRLHPAAILEILNTTRRPINFMFDACGLDLRFTCFRADYEKCEMAISSSSCKKTRSLVDSICLKLNFYSCSTYVLGVFKMAYCITCILTNISDIVC